MKKFISNEVRNLFLSSMLLSACCLLLSACECHPDCNRSVIDITDGGIDGDKLVFPAEGGDKDATIKTTLCWEVIDKPDWIESVAPNGGCGTTIVTCTAKPNATGTPRNDKITVRANNGDLASIKVEQAATDGPTVYVAGSLANRATLWVNGVPQHFSALPSTAVSVCVTTDNIVYVAGNIEDSAILWIDGVPQTGGNFAVTSLFVTEDGKFYVTGESQDESGSKAILWTDEGIQILSSSLPSTRTCAYSVFVTEGGMVYVAGQYESLPALWVNGSLQVLKADPLTYYGYATSVFVRNGVVYVGSSESWGWYDGMIPTLWIDNTPQKVPTPYWSETSEFGPFIHISSVFVTEDNKVYVAGHDVSASVNPSFVWTDGIPQLVLPTCGRIYSMFVTKNETVYLTISGSYDSGGAGQGLWINGTYYQDFGTMWDRTNSVFVKEKE